MRQSSQNVKSKERSMRALATRRRAQVKTVKARRARADWGGTTILKRKSRYMVGEGRR
jgi:hypothetical protein